MAKQHSNVPKFGNWESEDDVPYTVYFDKARKNKGGKMINPNDPQENPEMFANMMDPILPSPARPSKPTPKPEEPIRRRPIQSSMEHKDSQEDSDFRQFTNSPARSEGGRGQRQGRSTRPSAGSDYSFERSPLHQAKATGRGGGGSPLWEVRNNDSSNGTPARSRLRPAQPDEIVEKGTAVPRFGEWNESNPHAENFTHIFDKVREERNTVPKNASSTPKHPSYAPPSRLPAKPKKGCFGCW